MLENAYCINFNTLIFPHSPFSLLTFPFHAGHVPYMLYRPALIFPPPHPTWHTGHKVEISREGASFPFPFPLYRFASKQERRRIVAVDDEDEFGGARLPCLPYLLLLHYLLLPTLPASTYLALPYLLLPTYLTYFVLAVIMKAKAKEEEEEEEKERRCRCRSRSRSRSRYDCRSRS